MNREPSRGTLFSIALLASAQSYSAFAQFASVMPEGILALIGTHRSYVNQTHSWNIDGIRSPLNKRAQLRFDGGHLLRGEGGAKLQALAQELERYDPNPNNPNSVMKRLNLGTLNVGGTATMSIQYLGLAVGLPAGFTLYAAVPLVNISIKTNFAMEGKNNAKDLEDELGELAFEELRAGLNQAGQLTERDIKASIEAAEYTGVDSWRYQNLADVIAGVAFDIIPGSEAPEGIDFSLQAETFLSAPTGHVDNPDVIADVSIGTGAWGFGLALTPKVKFNQSYSLSVEGNAMAFMPSKQKMRVPEIDETIIPTSRRTMVDVQTGMDWATTLVFDSKFDWFQPQYRVGWKRHERDSIKGTLSGNYDSLMIPTEREQLEHALWLNFSTIEMYRENRFPIPFRLKVAAHHLFKGWNSFDNNYFELQLVSFLPTPWMRD